LGKKKKSEDFYFSTWEECEGEKKKALLRGSLHGLKREGVISLENGKKRTFWGEKHNGLN